MLFLSARPMRAATRRLAVCPARYNGFLPAQPVRAATQTAEPGGTSYRVSTRATRAGRDVMLNLVREGAAEFLPARPVRAATCVDITLHTDYVAFLPARPVRAETISIHSTSTTVPSFYPHDPCGPRLTLGLKRGY
ncbi:hypothetical protein [Billgrantia zhangzhouensis]|uniref:hypothetical protein n=1 Tax=Billgrantia zhangzhouensis TaxID=2733481 RepID=UPI00387E5E71